MSRFRSFIALIALLTVCLVLLRPLSTRSSYYRNVSGYSRSLSQWLRDEEDQYNQFLLDRQDLIRRWGPLPVDVKP